MVKKHAGAFLTGLLGVALAYAIATAAHEWKRWADIRDFVEPIMQQQRAQRQQAVQQGAGQPVPAPQPTPTPEVKK